MLEKLKELEATRAKLAAMEAAVADLRAKELAGLPERFGYADMAEFIAALKAIGGKRRGRKPGKAAKATKGKRSRATITDEMRSEVKKLAQAGKTGAEIAKTVGISLPSVQNIKKALGLVKARK